MGCVWKTVKGRRVRTGPVAGPVTATQTGLLDINAVLSLLKLPSVAGSARFTAHDLKDALVRIWRNPETGYFTEARFRSTAPPIYRPISQAEATAWEAGNPSEAMIAHAFTEYEIPSY